MSKWKGCTVIGALLTSLCFIALVIVSFAAIWSGGALRDHLGSTAILLFFLTAILGFCTALYEDVVD